MAHIRYQIQWLVWLGSSEVAWNIGDQWWFIMVHISSSVSCHEKMEGFSNHPSRFVKQIPPASSAAEAFYGLPFLGFTRQVPSDSGGPFSAQWEYGIHDVIPMTCKNLKSTHIRSVSSPSYEEMIHQFPNTTQTYVEHERFLCAACHY